MSRDSDSSSNSSSEEETKKHKRKHKSSDKDKSHRKSKKSKKHKKEKKHKSKSRRNEEEKHDTPVVMARPITVPVVEEEGAFGPALPPHLLAKPAIIGPTMPAVGLEKPTSSEMEKPSVAMASDDENSNDIYGPTPIVSGELNAVQLQLEQRALELKLAGIESANSTKSDQQVREEWMLELPKVGLKSGLAALDNMKRKFHQGKEKPDFSDRSDWTKTPNDGTEEKPSSSSKSTAEQLMIDAQSKYDKQRDDEQEAMAKKHKKKHKNEESLVAIHQKKLRKEERRKQKELLESGAKPERRRFTRDVDLKLNQIDKHQTKQIVDKAKILNTKFSSGQTKYL